MAVMHALKSKCTHAYLESSGTGIIQEVNVNVLQAMTTCTTLLSWVPVPGLDPPATLYLGLFLMGQENNLTCLYMVSSATPMAPLR